MVTQVQDKPVIEEWAVAPSKPKPSEAIRKAIAGGFTERHGQFSPYNNGELLYGCALCAVYVGTGGNAESKAKYYDALPPGHEYDYRDMVAERAGITPELAEDIELYFDAGTAARPGVHRGRYNKNGTHSLEETAAWLEQQGL